jgi:hypothetical protein
LTFEIPAGAVTDLAGNPVAASNQVKVFLDTARPVTSRPTTALRANTTLGDGTLPVAVSWTGSDVGPSGVASYDVARSFDGGPFHVIKAGITGSSINWTVRPGHTYRFEVRARDKAGNVGAWTSGVTLKPARIQQNSALVHFAGATTTTWSSAYSGGSERYLAASGASAVLQTKARAMSFVTTRAPGRGRVAIYVDGALRATIDLDAATTTYRYVAYSIRWSSLGTHRIRVVSLGGGRVDVDAFGVIR